MMPAAAITYLECFLAPGGVSATTFGGRGCNSGASAALAAAKALEALVVRSGAAAGLGAVEARGFGRGAAFPGVAAGVDAVAWAARHAA